MNEILKMIFTLQGRQFNDKVAKELKEKGMEFGNKMLLQFLVNIPKL